MIIQVDLSNGTASVTLDRPEDCGRFHVSVRGGTEAALEEAVTRHGLGQVSDPRHVMVEISAVRRLTEGRVGETWADEFAGMLSYAESKGWLGEDGRVIRAHVEWVPE